MHTIHPGFLYISGLHPQTMLISQGLVKHPGIMASQMPDTCACSNNLRSPIWAQKTIPHDRGGSGERWKGAVHVSSGPRWRGVYVCLKVIWQRKSMLSSNCLESQKNLFKDCLAIHKAANSLGVLTLQTLQTSLHLVKVGPVSPHRLEYRCAPDLLPAPTVRTELPGSRLHRLLSRKPDLTTPARHPLLSSLPGKQLQVLPRQITQLCPRRSENWFLRPKCSSKTCQVCLAENRRVPTEC